MSRKPNPVPVPEHVADEAIDKREARGTARQAGRAERPPASALDAPGTISVEDPARVLGTKKKEDGDE